MATRAYNEDYLNNAQKNLGQMMRYGTEDYGMPANSFFELFLTSGIAQMFGHGDYRFITGMSGIELAYEVLRMTCHAEPYPEPSFHFEKSDIYWAGWILAWYQWHSGLSFERIHEALKPEEIATMYRPFHEMDNRQFADEADRILAERLTVTRLRAYRNRIGISQAELARRSGCSLRMIQHYEQRQKDINKAQAETLLGLASVLRCPPEELLEYHAGDGKSMRYGAVTDSLQERIPRGTPS